MLEVSMKKLRALLKETIETHDDFPTPGVRFKDIQSFLVNPDLNSKIVDAITYQTESHLLKPDAVVAFDARGFLHGGMYAYANKIPFIMARKKGKLPGKVVSQKYGKEYGKDEICIQKGRIKRGMKVLLHDDLLATGGTSAAAAEIILREGGEIVGFQFTIELDYLDGRKTLEKFNAPIFSILHITDPKN
jgi:adenine phosphoribosyltransferase